MSSSVVDSWLDRLSEGEEEQPASRKRKAEEALKRQLKLQADEDLENYQALESRSLEPFLFISGNTKSRSSAKKRKTDEHQAMHLHLLRPPPLASRCKVT